MLNHETHFVDFGDVLPCMYILSTSRTIHLYASIFDRIVIESERINCSIRGSEKYLTVDMEMAVFTAARQQQAFHINTEACFFHFAQANYRYIQQLGN